MDEKARVQTDDWSRIYARLLNLLEQYGVNDAFGEGDYWLVDDDWGDRLHKLHVFNLSFLTHELVGALNHQLANFLGWRVMVTLDIHSPTAEEIPPNGLMIDGISVDEHWDRAQLKSLFGSSFHWAP